MSCSMKSTAMSSGSAEMTARISPLCCCGTPAAGSSSSSTFGSRRERQRDLEQPLAAVGELRGRPVAVFGEMQLREDFVGLVDRFVRALEAAPQRGADAAPLRDDHRHRFDRRQARKERVDLKRAREPRATRRSASRS
jgi:hypothetical protein